MTQKTKLILSFAALAMGALSLRGQDPTETPVPVATAPSSTVTLTPSFVSTYMFRGVRLGGPSFEPNVEWASGNLGIGIWANFPISDEVPGQSDPEIDPYIYYTITLSDSMSIVPGATWYNYPNADSSIGFYESTFEPFVTFNYTVGGVKLSPKLYYDMVLKGPTFEFTVAFSVPLKEAGTSLDFFGTFGAYKWDEAADGIVPSVKNYGNYWVVGVTVPFAITSSSKVVVGLAYTEGNNNFFKQSGSPKSENLAAVGRAVASVSYAITF